MSALQLHSLLGLLALPALALLLRERGRPLPLAATVRIVAVGLILQVGIAGIMLAVPAARALFMGIADLVDALQAATGEGTALVFGYVGAGPPPFEVVAPENTFILAFQSLPLVLLVSALTALLYHWGILQKVVAAFAWALGRSLGVSGPLATAASANIFVGMVEALLFVRPYLLGLDRGGLFAIMTVGLATIAGTMLILYATIVEPVVPDAAGHLVIASVISAPAALMIARIMVPPAGDVPAVPVLAVDPDTPHGPVDAIASGTRAGLQLLLSVIATLIVFVALVALANTILGAIGEPLGVPLSLEGIAGILFVPFAFVIGVPMAEASTAANLIGIKTVANEFVAYLMMAGEGGEGLSDRSRLILTYAMSGFANFGSLGILVGGLVAAVPERRQEVVSLGMRALVAGTLATLMTGSVIGLLTPP